MRVKLGTSAVLSFFDSSSVIGAEAFTATIKGPDGETIATPSLTAVISFPDLYLSESVDFSTVGQYAVTYTYNEDTVVSAGTIQVGADPVSDHPRTMEVDLLVDNRLAGGTDKTVQLAIIDSEGEVFLAADAAAYDADLASYKRAATFNDAGQYFLVWTKEVEGTQLPFHVDSILILTPSGAETCVFTAATLEGNNGNPHQSTVLVVSKEDGTYVADTLTDVVGDAALDLNPGNYLVSLIKTGTVFTNNNFPIKVLNTREVSSDPLLYSATASEVQAFQLVTTSLAPTYSDPASPADMCTLYATLYKMNGKPLSNAVVHVRLVQAPSLYDGAGVFDTNRVYKTDANGRLEFDLIQGITVEVSIAPLSLRRVVEVPSGDDALEKVNLLTLLSGADDVFDIISPKVPAAPRRTLE